MTKFITLIFIILISLTSVYSQDQCTPNAAYTIPGIYPDSASGFPPAVATYPYAFDITAVIPKDTIVFPLPRLPIDSIGVHEVLGLPDGFQAIPNRPSGYWPGGTSGCMRIMGTPGKNQVGVYPLTFRVVGYMLGLPYAYEISYYSITVLDSVFFGIPLLPVKGNIRLKAFPNPFTQWVNFDFIVDDPGTYEYLVYDTRNRLLKTGTITSSAGANSHRFDGSSFGPGIYFLVLRNTQKNQTTAIKLMKY